MSTFVSQFRAARRVGTPLIAIQTLDPAATIEELRDAVAQTSPFIQWDICRGWTALNPAGRDTISAIVPNAEDVVSATGNPVEMLILAARLPERTVLVLHNANRYLREDGSPASAGFAQALWNLRDLFKSDLRTAVLLSPSFTFPAELQQDVFVLDEPLPTDVALTNIVTTLSEAAEQTLDEATRDRAVDALRGLSAFPAEQVVAMSMTAEGLDLDGVWERKRRMIESTPGLSVWRGGDRFVDIGGNDQIKSYLNAIVAGRDAPRVVVFVDEIEKMFAGATGGAADSSGVSQGFLGTLLSYMQDNEASGMIFVGPPGAGKSAVAKAIGGEAGVPTISLDLNGMKDSLVGASEARLRNALKVITAVGGGRALFVATCNKIATLPPELRRRFTMGTFFFDLPDEAERDAIWKIYYKKYELNKKEPRPADSGWTGAEIKQCCLLAYRLQQPLADVAKFVVPVARSASDDILSLRKQADRRYLSAAYPGVYEFQQGAVQDSSAPSRSRKIAKEEAL